MIAAGSSSRVSRLSQALQDAGADAFFAATPDSMRYLVGFGEHPHERFLALGINGNGEMVLICPALSENQARRAGMQEVRSWRDGEDPLALFQQLATEWNLRSSIIAVDDEMSARQLLQMQSVLPAALFKPGLPILSNLKRNKDAQEIETMARAGKIADDALAAGIQALRPGATEQEVSDALAQAMRAGGGKPTFSIIGAGKNGAEPHHETDSTVIQAGDVVCMDFGCELDGYQSDITRCVACGKAEDEAHKVYKVVFDAHMAGREMIRPGVQAQAIDRATRNVIEKAGYGEFFVHRTGHGIGMQGHEEPNIVQGNETLLQEGDCFSIEPGIYLPGRFGIRIENIVCVTADGHRSLNEEPAGGLLEVGV